LLEMSRASLRGRVSSRFRRLQEVVADTGCAVAFALVDGGMRGAVRGTDGPALVLPSPTLSVTIRTSRSPAELQNAGRKGTE
jgi:hypothetical protein